ncbi:J domain-containing protein [Paraburkholderia sp. GAS334]|uniref:J domain-containing protein n=1 Tax=Paraburkholderia sp. GAS334 TaxID=3035131 RepID=UPI003D1DFB4A
MTTLYDTLGVPASATGDEIKRAYRKAAMRWHPDRNAGHEDVARAAFQDVKNAYAILSDAAQREVYDAVYAEQMRVWETHQQRKAREQAEREAAARAAEEAAYAEMVALAMRFADEGHNRDVVFGVLIGQQCEAGLAAQIAASAVALHASRQAPPVVEEEVAAAPDDSRSTAATDDDAHPAKANGNANGSGLGTLWYQFLSGLRF